MNADDIQKNSTVIDTNCQISSIGTGRSYDGGGIKNTFHCFNYQMKVLMLYILRSLKQNCKFQVGIDVEGAHKFDDLLFLYDNYEIGFIQTIHKLNDVKITEDQLLGSVGDFSISKYYHSYSHILEEKQFKNILKDRDMILVIHTNVGIECSVLQSFEHVSASSILSGNKILDLSTDMNGCYIIKRDSSLYEKVFDLLQNLNQPSSRLAENLAEAAANSKRKSIRVDKLYEKYREWLISNVLNVGEEYNNRSQKVYYATFKDSFLSEPRECVIYFREIFLKTYLS